MGRGGAMSLLPHAEYTQKHRWLLNGFGACALDVEPGDDVMVFMNPAHERPYFVKPEDVEGLRSREDGASLAVTILLRELNGWERPWR